MKKTASLLFLLFYVLSLTAQTQYDYYDDSAVAGGANGALNGIIIFVLLIVGIFVFFIIGGLYYKIKYWFNPTESLEYKVTKKKQVNKEQRLKEEKRKVQRKNLSQAEERKDKKAIDLGLSVLWADSNLYENDNFGKCTKFSWGDIATRTLFRYIDGKLNKKSKYELKRILGNDDLSICGNKKYDAAKNLWGDNWRLPQKQEFEELINQCEWEWTTINNISGYKVIGKNGNSIFLPITGESVVDKICSPHAGFYWSGTANSDILGEEAYFLYLDEKQNSLNSCGIRWHGMAIRPVWFVNNEVVEVNGFTMSSYGTKLIKCNDIEDCHIPYGVKIISKEAFKDVKNIKNLYIPNSVEEIEAFAFSFLTVETVYIPKSINKWGECAFYYCTMLKKVTIEDGLSKLGTSMFYGCKSLANINIPDTIESLPDEIFGNCI